MIIILNQEMQLTNSSWADKRFRRENAKFINT